MWSPVWGTVQGKSHVPSILGSMASAGGQENLFHTPLMYTITLYCH